MTSKREEARKILEKLIQKVNKIITSDLSKYVNDETYLKYTVTEIRRNEQGIVSGAQWESERVVRKSYLPFYIWLSEFKENEDFKNAINKITTIYDIKYDRLTYPVERLIQREIVEGINTDDIDQFLNELEGKLPSWKIIARMKGIFIKDEEIVINNIKIRPVKKEDLTYEQTIYSTHYSPYIRLPHSILELTIDNAQPPYIQYRLENLLLILSLYRVASVSYINYKMISNNFFNLSGGTIGGGKLLTDKPILTLTNQDGPKLERFILNIEPLISKTCVVIDELKTPIDLSIRRYIDSIRISGKLEEKILQSIMGLEVLFLTHQTEARFRLALRVSQTMGYLNEDSLKTYSNILKAYEYRSSYVHGSTLKKKDQDKASLILFEIHNYLRKAILLWMLLDLNTKKRKEKFLDDIDKSLINEEKRDLLKQKIDGIKDIVKDII